MDESVLAKEKRVANLRAANEKKTAEARKSVLSGLEKLVRTTGAVNINAVAEAANVSRGFIYSQPDLRAKIIAAGTRSKSKVRSSSRSPNEVSLISRIETALDTIGELKAENQHLKQRIENLTAQLVNESISR